MKLNQNLTETNIVIALLSGKTTGVFENFIASYIK
jgi:hypothetical protein